MRKQLLNLLRVECGHDVTAGRGSSLSKRQKGMINRQARGHNHGEEERGTVARGSSFNASRRAFKRNAFAAS